MVRVLARQALRGLRAHMCDLDSVAVADNLGGYWSTGTACSLGKFAPVSPEQAELVRVELSSR